jgi:hypothetical protein
MKPLYLVMAVMVLALSTMGSSCVNDNFLIAVNVPITHTFTFTATGGSSFSDNTTINLGSVVGDTFADNIASARVYDITLTYAGPYTGTLSGTISVNGTKVADFTGAANDFKTTKSLLASPSYFSNVNITPVLTALGTKPLPTITLAGSAVLSPAPTSGTQHSVTVEILAQADANVQ